MIAYVNISFNIEYIITENGVPIIQKHEDEIITTILRRLDIINNINNQTWRLVDYKSAAYSFLLSIQPFEMSSIKQKIEVLIKDLYNEEDWRRWLDLEKLQRRRRDGTLVELSDPKEDALWEQMEAINSSGIFKQYESKKHKPLSNNDDMKIWRKSLEDYIARAGLEGVYNWYGSDTLFKSKYNFSSENEDQFIIGLYKDNFSCLYEEQLEVDDLLKGLENLDIENLTLETKIPVTNSYSKKIIGLRMLGLIPMIDIDTRTQATIIDVRDDAKEKNQEIFEEDLKELFNQDLFAESTAFVASSLNIFIRAEGFEVPPWFYRKCVQLKEKLDLESVIVESVIYL